MDDRISTKTKEDYPIVLTPSHVAEIMDYCNTSATKYINEANLELKRRGLLVNIIKNARIPRDRFFEIYGI
jgi:hypothetical protein